MRPTVVLLVILAATWAMLFFLAAYTDKLAKRIRKLEKKEPGRAGADSHGRA